MPASGYYYGDGSNVTRASVPAVAGGYVPSQSYAYSGDENLPTTKTITDLLNANKGRFGGAAAQNDYNSLLSNAVTQPAQMAQQGRQFGQSLAEQVAQRLQQNEQFGQSQAQQGQQFGQSLAEQTAQRLQQNQQFGQSQAQQGQQFGQSLAEQIAQRQQQGEQFSQTLQNSIAQANRDFTENQRRYGQDFAERQREADINAAINRESIASQANSSTYSNLIALLNRLSGL